jgi:prepilin-type N-terminal cleavage/methylation domain-containing protein
MTTHYSKYRNQTGFTLVELLIVAIILSILAAIAVPQFTSTTDDAAKAALKSNLTGIRSAIDLYAQQHGGNFPGAVASTGGTCTGGTAGSGAASSNTAFEEQLLYYTNATGQACSIADVPVGGAVEFPYGPYVKSDIPNNPVTNNGTITVVSSGNLTMTGSGADGGWRYDTKSGKFIADDTNQDENGTSYDAY